jgi:hypothetical protein
VERGGRVKANQQLVQTQGKPFAVALRYPTVWVKINGKWQIVSDQGTLITP